MTPDLSDFVNIDHSHRSKIKVGNGECVEARGKGDVAIQTPKGTKLISNVLYAPNISQSLLSVGQMLERNYALHFQKQSCIIQDSEGNEILRVKMIGKSFPILWKVTSHTAGNVREDETEIWHKRLGHVHYRNIREMQSKNLVQNLPIEEQPRGVCKVCQLGKMSRKPFPMNQAWRASEKL